MLRCIRPLTLDQVLLGQYGKNADGTKMGYLDDPTVTKGSKTPTFAAVALFVENDRWHNVPWILKAGKGKHNSTKNIP